MSLWVDVCLRVQIHRGTRDHCFWRYDSRLRWFFLLSRWHLRWLIWVNFQVSGLEICPFCSEWFIICVFCSRLLDWRLSACVNPLQQGWSYLLTSMIVGCIWSCHRQRNFACFQDLGFSIHTWIQWSIVALTYMLTYIVEPALQCPSCWFLSLLATSSWVGWWCLDVAVVWLLVFSLPFALLSYVVTSCGAVCCRFGGPAFRSRWVVLLLTSWAAADEMSCVCPCGT